MRAIVIVSALAVFPAHADLYRWIDRETGSVKFSNAPPPWYGDPQGERGAPAVEIIRPPKPPARREAAKPAPNAVATLEANWVELTKFFDSLPPTTDFTQARTGLRPQIEAYVALSSELDRLDPAGAARRRALQPKNVDLLR